MSAVASPVRARRSPRSGLADRVLDWRTHARISVGELASPVLQALRGAARSVYLFLRACASVKKGMIVQMGYARIAGIIGVHRDTVREAVDDLIHLGLLIKRRCYGLDAAWSSPGDLPNEYTVLRPADAVAAQDRRTRREAGEQIPEAELEGVIVLEVEHEPGSSESLTDQAARLARAAALAMMPALEAELGTLASSAELLKELPRFEQPSTWHRIRYLSAAQDCIRARSALVQADRALVYAQAALSADLAALAAEEPGARGWTSRLAKIRLSIAQAAAVAQLVSEAAFAAERASATWTPLLTVQPRRQPKGDQAALALVVGPGAADELPATPAGPWAPPPGWRPISGPRSPKTWGDHREMWAVAEGLGKGGETIRRRLREQGFDPRWPDPVPSTA